MDDPTYARLAQLYARALDADEPALLRSIFTDDAVIAGSRLRFDGIQEIAAIPQLLRRKYHATHHFIGNAIVIRRDGADAAAEAYCLANHIRARSGHDGETYVMGIRYQDRLVRHDGVWRFHRRHLHVDWVETRECSLAPGH